MISKSTKYCLKVIIHLAQSHEANKKFTLAELSQELNIPKHFLGNLLQQLTKQEMLSSQKGRNGGFYLTEEHLQKRPMDYIQQIEGGEFMNQCILGMKPCDDANPCPLHSIFFKLRQSFLKEMGHVTLEDLVKDSPILPLTNPTDT